jgi:hypothetical protein
MRLSFLVLPLTLLFVLGCDQLQDAPKTPPVVPIKVLPPVTINPDLIDVFDGRVQRSKAFRIDGDLRPIWIVTGRIRNHSDKEIKSVTLRIDITPKSTAQVVDETTLTIDIDILPYAVGSFSRDIQMMPPNTDWDWTYGVINVDPK